MTECLHEIYQSTIFFDAVAASQADAPGFRRDSRVVAAASRDGTAGKSPFPAIVDRLSRKNYRQTVILPGYNYVSE
jgi:hypothetical protein